MVTTRIQKKRGYGHYLPDLRFLICPPRRELHRLQAGTRLDRACVPPRATGTTWSAVAGLPLVNGPPHQWQQVAPRVTSAEMRRHPVPYPRCAAVGRPGRSVFRHLVATAWQSGQRWPGAALVTL